jgi:hypothetical protein
MHLHAYRCICMDMSSLMQMHESASRSAMAKV